MGRRKDGMPRHLPVYLPKAHGGCTCDCHTSQWVKHIAPCCYPLRDPDNEYADLD